MIAEIAKDYRGVLCRRCREPIPISVKVASLHDEIEASEPSAPHAFVARCRMCDGESVYAMGEIQVIEGTPPARRLRARAAGR